MDRLKATYSVAFANRDTAPVSGTAQYATDGDPSTSTPPTIWPAYASNMLIDEMIALIVAAGLTPDDTDWTQLLQAATVLFGSGRLLGIKEFTASGTYTPDPKLAYCIVELVPGGSGGGGAQATTSGTAAAGGPGLSGPQAVGKFTAVQVGASVPITIGSGGAGAAAGNNSGGAGGTTSFGSLMSSTGFSGGAGGPSSSDPYCSSAGATGGVVTGANLKNFAPFGSYSYGYAFGDVAYGGTGASGPYSFGSTLVSATGTQKSDGGGGVGPGAGGGGGASANGGGSAKGGGGQPGFLRVWEYS